MTNKEHTIKCANCTNFYCAGQDAEGKYGFCDDFAHFVRADWRCDGAAFHAKKEVEK